MRNIEEVYAIAGGAMETGIGLLKDGVDVNMMIHLIGRDDRPDELLLPNVEAKDDDTITTKYKDAIDQIMRAKLSTGQFEAVVMMSPARYAHVTPDQDAIVSQIGIAAAAKRGLCCMHQAIIVVVETPMIWEEWQQEFVKVDGKVQTVGGLVKNKLTDVELTRFGGMFPQSGAVQ